MSSTLRNSPAGKASTNEDSRASAILERVREGLVLLDDAVVELADADETLGLAGLIAKRLGLEPEDVFRAIAVPSEQLLTVLCRAAGLNLNGFSAVLRMRCRSRGAIHSPAQALTAFHDMPVETAQRMVLMAKGR
jgi:hypothetical protein